MNSTIERIASTANEFQGETLSWQSAKGVIELVLHRTPCNELGSLSLDELEQFASALDKLETKAHTLIVYSELKSGFCAGADLSEASKASGGDATTDRTRQLTGLLRAILELAVPVVGAAKSTPASRIPRRLPSVSSAKPMSTSSKVSRFKSPQSPSGVPSRRPSVTSRLGAAPAVLGAGPWADASGAGPGGAGSGVGAGGAAASASVACTGCPASDATPRRTAASSP